MNVYLAGLYSRPYVAQEMNIYLSAPKSYPNVLRDFAKEDMNIYIAGIGAGNNPVWRENTDQPEKMEEIFPLERRIFILESFYYVQDWMIPYIGKYWNFLLDSGAFTFMENASKARIDWNEYVERYAAFINEHNIELFFELDIDSVVGLKEVERLREKQESLTKKKCIPVWHRSRGKDYWFELIKSYSYVAVGGIVSGEIKRTEFSIFTHLLKAARDHDCKVHGLGFTNIRTLNKYPFYSVDSTAWIYGNRSGFVYRFNGKTIEKVYVPANMKLKSREAAIHNFQEWIKFQRFAEKNL